MNDLNDRYYKSERLSWLVFLFIVFNKYGNFDVINIPYIGIVKNIDVVYVSAIFLLLFIWSQVEYIQSNVENKNKIILFRNLLLWLFLTATISFNIYLQSYTEIEIYIWIVGCFILGLILGKTLMVSLIMNLSAIFIKKYRLFIFDNIIKIIIDIAIICLIYFLVQKYTPSIVFENIILLIILVLGIILSIFKQLVKFFKYKNFSDFQESRQKNIYIKYLSKFRKYQKVELSEVVKEAFKQNAVVNSKTNQPMSFNKAVQKQIIKQLKKGDYDSTESPKELQKRAREFMKNNFDGRNYPLSHAVINENIEEVEMLLKTINPNSEIESGTGWNPLLMAVANGSSDITDILLKKGANPDKANLLGITPLLYACRYDDLPTIKKLIEYGADVDCIDKDGVSLLMLAVMSNSKEIVLYLLSQNTVLKIKKAIKIAEKMSNGDIARILRKHKK